MASVSLSLWVARSATLMAINAPLIGWRRRCFLSRPRNPVQAARSTASSLSCVVKRPAVSISTASLVNHQSQLRVPPTPEMASLPSFSASGNCKPELTSAVVFPAPGGPMMMYHGS